MFSRRVQSCFFILLVLGSSQALLIDFPQDSINGTVNHYVLLPISYRFQGPFPSPLTIQWYFSNSPNPLTTYTLTNCSVSAEGIPPAALDIIIHISHTEAGLYFFPENASLLLQNLQLSDSGVYNVIFKEPQQTRHITLTVSEPHFNNGNSDTGSEDTKARSTSKTECAIFAVRVLCGFITIGALFLVLFLHFTHMTCSSCLHRRKALNPADEIRFGCPQVPCISFEEGSVDFFISRMCGIFKTQHRTGSVPWLRIQREE